MPGHDSYPPQPPSEGYPQNWARPIPVDRDYRLDTNMPDRGHPVANPGMPVPRGQYHPSQPGDPIRYVGEPFRDKRTGRTFMRATDGNLYFVQLPTAAPERLSWPEAYRAYRANPREGRKAVLFAKLSAAAIGFNVVDDVVPLLGQVDDVVLPLQSSAFALSAAYTLWRVSKHRRPGFRGW